MPTASNHFSVRDLGIGSFNRQSENLGIELAPPCTIQELLRQPKQPIQALAGKNEEVTSASAADRQSLARP